MVIISRKQDLTPRTPFPFFRLSRELRDTIYHHLCLSTPYITQRFGTQRIYLTLFYHPRSLPTILNVPVASPSRQPPTWLLANKTILNEGRAQFMRHAAWYYYGLLLQWHDWTRILNIDLERVTHMQMYVENLANWETPARQQGTDDRERMQRVAGVMRSEKLRFESVRLVGHSYVLQQGEWTCGGQAENMVRNLMAVFCGVEVGRWEFGIREPYNKEVWVLFDWVGGDGEERLVVREKGEESVEEAKARLGAVSVDVNECRGEKWSVDWESLEIRQEDWMSLMHDIRCYQRN
jgi:hypothetical protein